MTKQLKLIGIGATVICLGVGLTLSFAGRANSLKAPQSRKTENLQNANDFSALTSLKADEQITASLQNKSETKPVTRRLALDQDGDIDPRGQMQESVEEKINALSPLKQRNFFKKHFPVIVNQKPKTGIKRILKSNSGVVLKKEYRNGKVKYFDRKGNYLKQKNRDGSWQFKLGYSTEKDWHLQII